MGKGSNRGQQRKAAQMKKLARKQAPHGVRKRGRSDPPAPRAPAPPAATPKPGSAGVGRSVYVPGMRILLLGEGDFSFAAALALLWGDASGLTATAYDDEAVALNKYVAAAENVETLRSLGAKVAFGVDATRLQAAAIVRQARRGFDRVVFNFPHAGGGIKDQARNIDANQQLLRGLFACVCGTGVLAADGELHLTLKRGEPYDSWKAVTLAKLAGLRVKHCTPFEAARFPGYAHRRTIGDEHAGEDAVVSGKTYAFVEKGAAEDEAEEKASSGRGAPQGTKRGKGSGKNGAKSAVGNKILPTGQTYKDAWKQRHRKAKR